MNLYRIGTTLILLLFVQLNAVAVQYLSFEFATTKPLVHAVGSVSVIDKRADTNATLGRGNTKVMSPFTNLLSQNQ